MYCMFVSVTHLMATPPLLLSSRVRRSLHVRRCCLGGAQVRGFGFGSTWPAKYFVSLSTDSRLLERCCCCTSGCCARTRRGGCCGNDVLVATTGVCGAFMQLRNLECSSSSTTSLLSSSSLVLGEEVMVSMRHTRLDENNGGTIWPCAGCEFEHSKYTLFLFAAVVARVLAVMMALATKVAGLCVYFLGG
jgi:hypothetical protein